MTVRITGHIKKVQTLALKIQQAFLHNEEIYYGRNLDIDVIAQLPSHIIKILFQKEWLSNCWEYLPETAPWDYIDFSKLDVDKVSKIINKVYSRTDLKIDGAGQIYLYAFKNVPLPITIPQKITLEMIIDLFYRMLYIDDITIRDNKILNILKHINHAETKITHDKETDIPYRIDNIKEIFHNSNIKAFVNEIKNNELFYLYLDYLAPKNIKYIPQAAANIFLKPIEPDCWKHKLIFLLKNKFIKPAENTFDVLRKLLLLNMEINLKTIIAEKDFTTITKPITIKLFDKEK
jgi:hypothetical protein